MEDLAKTAAVAGSGAMARQRVARKASHGCQRQIPPPSRLFHVHFAIGASITMPPCRWEQTEQPCFLERRNCAARRSMLITIH